MADPQTPVSDSSWFGHPKQLAWLFATEMWERFGYYGMRALLTLYLAKHFLFSDTTTNGIYGGFTALVYFTPLIGGLIADRYLGSKRSVKFGAIIMAIGYFTLCFGGTPAKPKAIIDGTTYDVTVKGEGKERKQYVTVDDRELRIRGNDDKSISLLGPDEAEVKKIEPAKFESSAERSATHVFILLIGLCLVTVGNGFFKPNISTIVGTLYPAGDRRRDAGFTIFYMGINLGSFLSQVFCPYVADTFGWHYGFGLAAVGMLLSWTLISFDGGRLNGYGERPAGAPTNRDPLIYLAALATVPIFYLLFVNLMSYVPPKAGDEGGIVAYVMNLPVMGKLLFGTFLIGVPAILVWSFLNGTRKEFEMMVAAMVLICFNVVFWTLFEQAGSSLTLFAERNTDLSFFGLFSISAGQTQFFNALFIVLLAPVFSILWNALAKKGLEPSIPIKFAIALMGVGLGFLFLVFGASFAGPDFKVTVWWLAGLYLIHSVAELCISPVGLSMITKLSIVRIVGMMMGVWFLSTSVAQYVAGIVAQFASVETVGGEVTNLKVSLETYLEVFKKIGYVSIGIGVVLLVLSLPLKKWMHGVK